MFKTAKLKEKFINPKTNLLITCAWCQAVCDNDRNWTTLDIKSLSVLTKNVSHGICPDCFKQLLHTEKQYDIKLSERF